MQLEIIKNPNAPKFKKVKMLCDVSISKKLDKMDVIKDYFNKANTTVLVGPQGSGKSSILMNFVKIYYGRFQKVYVFMRESSRLSIKDNVFDDELPPEQLFEDLTYDGIASVYEQVKDDTKQGYFSWIIFDDVQDAMKDKEIVKVLNKMVANQRHLKLVIFIVLQNFYALDSKVRKLTNNLFLFRLDKRQMEQIFDDYIRTDEKTFKRICSEAYKENHDFLFINLNNQRFYNRNFDELKITD